MKLVTTQSLDTNEVVRILPEARVVVVQSDEGLLRESQDAEILYGVRPGVLQQILRTSSTVRWAHTSSAGVDAFLSDELRNSTVRLTCAKGGAAGRNLAEHALGLALALSRNIGEAARSTHWRRGELSAGAFELSGRVAGIAGYGGAGREMTQLLIGFRMSIVAVKRTPPHNSSETLRVLPPVGFSTMCRESDVVFNFLPSTSDTERIFDRAAFETMKRSALFVNVGRGSTVDTKALVQALQEGLIAGAGIDAVEPEPLPEQHPLWSMANVVISPHIAGNSPDRTVRNWRVFLENLERYRDGRELLSVVDPGSGY